ncbi:BA75_01860T0 [Komagataella pastoris]|uniref:BA75_01860T0 n=1 Tax=Komagataella pastoris TaxID=4922 RepID=A0A1B2J7E6_PICPA|nr:BA75_01860T0 [Komagataella pastoris]
MNYEYKHISKLVPRHRVPFFISILLTTVLSPVTMGYDSLMMGNLNALPQYLDYFHIRDDAALLGWMSAAVWVGSILSCFFMQQLSDRLGRKQSIVISVMVGLVGVILQSAAKNVAMFSIGRVIIGFGTQLSVAAAPTLISELALPKHRGFLGGLAFTCFQVGALIASGVTYGTRNITTTWAWRIPSIIQCVPALFSIAALVFIPESPRWLISVGQFDKASEVISIAEGIDIDAGMKRVQEIQAVIEEEKARVASNPWKEITKGVYNWKRLFIMLTQGLVTELAGSSVGTYYFSLLLNQAGVSDVSTVLQVGIIQSSWCLVIALIACFTLDIVGRKPQALFGTTGMIVSFFILGGLIEKYGDSDNVSGSYGAIACMFLFQGFYNLCWTPMNTLYPPEIWPFKLRSAGVTVFKFFNCGFGLFGTFILPIGMSNLGWKFYMLNAGYDIIFLPIIYFVWVETKGVSLETLDELIGCPVVLDEESLSSVELVQVDGRGKSDKQ